LLTYCPRTAKQAKCSCGKNAALACTCEKSTTENIVAGPRCSCRARPAGECTCDRSATENAKPVESAAGDIKQKDPRESEFEENEIDFTGKK
jgi:hypothetical protein